MTVRLVTSLILIIIFIAISIGCVFISLGEALFDFQLFVNTSNGTVVPNTENVPPSGAFQPVVNQFTTCKGDAFAGNFKLQCFASQKCDPTQPQPCNGGIASTLGNQQPVPNVCQLRNNVFGIFLCGTGPAQVRMFGFAGMMAAILVLWVLFCCDDYLYQRKLNKPRKSDGKPNAPMEHKTAKDFHREKAESIFNHSTAIIDAYDKFERLQNTEQIAIAADVMDVVGLYRLIALATVNVTHVDGAYKALKGNSINPIDEVMLRMEKTQSDMEYVLDGVNKLDQRKAALPGLKTSLLKTIDRHPFPLDGRPLIDAVASGNYVLHSEAFRAFESRTLSLLPVFEQASSMVDVNSYDPKPISAPWFPLLMQYKIVYGVFWIFIIVTFALMAKDSGLQGQNGKQSLQQFNNANPSGFGKTFFPVPPQYTFEVVSNNIPGLQPTNIPGTTLNHPFATPIIYGVMHCALVALGLVPVPLWRGVWRDVLYYVPLSKKIIPIDHFDEVHRQLGYFVLACIAAGATIWIFAMGFDCLNGFRDTCLAFDPIVDNFADPTENVLVLRYVIFSTWFTMIPLMQFAFRPPPLGLGRITFLAKYWYEICFFAHYIATVVGLVLALLGRFGIFFPVLISWGVYFCDKAREFVFNTHAVTMASRQSFNRSNSGYPTAYRIHFERPAKLEVTAGQWMYLCVPAIDQVWHPFSICSSSGDDKLTFHIGIRTTGDPGEQWTSQAGVGGRSWTLTPETWTYRLFKRLDVSHPYLKAYVRGPYGAAFVSCFNPLNAGVMVIGAGTGLTAAESVVREILYRKANGTPVPLRLWFVWSCRTVDDLFWCWQSMIELLLAAFDAQTIDSKAVASTGAALDWLGVTIYVSRADKASMELLRALYPKPAPPPMPSSSAASGRMRAVTDADNAGGRMRSVTDSAGSDGASSTYQQAAKGADAGGANIYGALKDVMAAYTKAPSRAAGDAKVNYSKMQEGKPETYQPMNQLWQTQEAPMPGAGVTMANALAVDNTLELNDEMIAARRAHVGYWLVNRIVEGSIDSEKTHIERHLRSMRRLLQNNSGPLSVCFCGPPAVAHVVERATRRVATEGHPIDIEFSSDSQ